MNLRNVFLVKEEDLTRTVEQAASEGYAKGYANGLEEGKKLFTGWIGNEFHRDGQIVGFVKLDRTYRYGTTENMTFRGHLTNSIIGERINKAFTTREEGQAWVERHGSALPQADQCGTAQSEQKRG